MERDTNFSFAKQSKSTIPVQVEAETINSVTHQVVNHNIDAATIKSDSKICVDKGGAKGGGGREEAIAPRPAQKTP